MWLCDVPTTTARGGDLNDTENTVWASGYPWKDGEREEAWEGIDIEKFTAAWTAFEAIRREEMKGEPHW